ncbi:MAG: ribosome biogenesis GTP-binding protein YihA/YsxC [Oscillospiraceae bacterium]|nr:ribosome biogenesis GTP-binding protein YihA/YsxC [Oscillospiraceae bacterium]
MNLHNVEFIKSAAAAGGLLHDTVPQIVFSGKSNVGKSSVINKLLNRKSAARVSSRPGKTVHINYFLIDKKAYFVDLPGYGYARVAKTEQARWSGLMEIYFSSADHIALGIMIVDSRHPPTKDDLTMGAWFKATGCPMVVVANKVDKLKNSEKDKNLEVIRRDLDLREDIPVIPFSAEKGTNKELLLDAVFKAVEDWNNV